MDAHKFTFKGTVYQRSSAHPPKQPDVPGEAEIFRCNPRRSRRIMEKTGWDRVFRGALKLSVPEDVFDRLYGNHQILRGQSAAGIVERLL